MLDEHGVVELPAAAGAKGDTCQGRYDRFVHERQGLTTSQKWHEVLDMVLRHLVSEGAL